jgi:hypothetical protein
LRSLLRLLDPGGFFLPVDVPPGFGASPFHGHRGAWNSRG